MVCEREKGRKMGPKAKSRYTYVHQSIRPSIQRSSFQCSREPRQSGGWRTFFSIVDIHFLYYAAGTSDHTRVGVYVRVCVSGGGSQKIEKTRISHGENHGEKRKRRAIGGSEIWGAAFGSASLKWKIWLRRQCCYYILWTLIGCYYTCTPV